MPPVPVSNEQFNQEIRDNLHDYTDPLMEVWEMSSVGDGLRIPSGFITMVERVGGHEGDGETLYMVVKLGNQYFRADGHFNSWESGIWWEGSEFYEVVQQPVTRYEYLRK